MKPKFKVQPFTPQQVQYLRENFPWRVLSPGTSHDHVMFHMGQQSVIDFIEKDMVPEHLQQIPLEGM